MVCCGTGNNGGDGYVLALHALKAGFDITIWQMAPINEAAMNAKTAYKAFIKAGGSIETKYQAKPYDVAVDALLGIGINRPLSDTYLQAVQQINALPCPVLAIDIPTGLNANTGYVANLAVKASLTINFIALKQGLFTGNSSEYCGEIVHAPLGIQKVFEQQFPFVAKLLQLDEVVHRFPIRVNSVHKGDMGKVLCIGGSKSMGGALILTWQVALRSGAGLVTLLCSKKNHSAVLACQTELMVAAWKKKQKIEKIRSLLNRASVFAFGPGLGRLNWSKQLFHTEVKLGIENTKPMVVDADALYWLAKYPVHYDNWVLTPHMQEAARLLKTDIKQVEQDRFSAIKSLQQSFGGVVVLKGAGTLVYDGEHLVVINAGNAGMASAGIGDVLTGIIASLFAQGLSLFQAASFGAFLHSFSADCAAMDGKRSLVASDLLPLIGKDF